MEKCEGQKIHWKGLGGDSKLVNLMKKEEETADKETAGEMERI